MNPQYFGNICFFMCTCLQIFESLFYMLMHLKIKVFNQAVTLDQHGHLLVWFWPLQFKHSIKPMTILTQQSDPCHRSDLYTSNLMESCHLSFFHICTRRLTLSAVYPQELYVRTPMSTSFRPRFNSAGSVVLIPAEPCMITTKEQRLEHRVFITDVNATEECSWGWSRGKTWGYW